MSDEQYHEFRLEGKPLVFLFMAALTVVVVSFLCGVMVGRGVRMERPDEGPLARADPIEDPTRFADLPSEEISDGPVSDAQGSEEALSYFRRLNDTDPVTERLAPPEAALPAAAPPAPPVPEPVRERPGSVAAPASPPASQVAAASAPSPAPDGARMPEGRGFVVQVMSVTKREEAETVAQRLASKGYPSFVQPMPDGRFRVRVGTYPDRRQADTVARRLEREEKFREPWVDR